MILQSQRKMPRILNSRKLKTKLLKMKNKDSGMRNSTNLMDLIIWVMALESSLLMGMLSVESITTINTRFNREPEQTLMMIKMTPLSQKKMPKTLNLKWLRRKLWSMKRKEMRKKPRKNGLRN